MKLADEIERLRKSSRSNDFIEFIADHGEELIRILRASDDVGRMREEMQKIHSTIERWRRSGHPEDPSVKIYELFRITINALSPKDSR